MFSFQYLHYLHSVTIVLLFSHISYAHKQNQKSGFLRIAKSEPASCAIIVVLHATAITIDALLPCNSGNPSTSHITHIAQLQQHKHRPAASTPTHRPRRKHRVKTSLVRYLHPAKLSSAPLIPSANHISHLVSAQTYNKMTTNIRPLSHPSMSSSTTSFTTSIPPMTAPPAVLYATLPLNPVASHNNAMPAPQTTNNSSPSSST